MKNKKNFILLLFIVTIITIPLVKSLENNYNEYGKITIDKYATKKDITYGRDADVTLEVKGNSYNKKIKMDIVLILDRSSSMDNKIDNKTKIALVKEQAINLINTLLDNENDVNIGIVTFGTRILNNYSTNKLENNKKTLNNLINSIPNNKYNEATNIHEALEKAKELLLNSTANKKAIILLTDGMPTKFTYENKVYGTGINDNEVCYIEKGKNCTKTSPSKMAEKIALELKKHTTIYTIGFGVSNEAKIFLKDKIASSQNDFYLANNINNLKDNFKDIIEKINIIAKDITITDTIPNTFILDKESIKVNEGTNIEIVSNDDGSTNLIWKINKLDISTYYKLTYNIIASSPYYGLMYTNSNATLKGTATVDNPYYQDKNILLTFKKPTVPIPAITENDDYTNITLYKKEQLEINQKEGLLTNDKLHQINDNNANINNTIKIVPNSLSCGKLEDININNDGSFTYQSNEECLGKITFDYYIISNINETKTISNTSKVTLNVAKKPTTYTVKYLDYETKKPLYEEKKVTDKYLYDEIIENAPIIEKYNLIGNNSITKTIDIENEEIIFYYVKTDNLTYVIDYYYDNVLDIDKREIITNNKIDEIINEYKNKIEYGYILDHVENIPLTIQKDITKNIIKVYYKRLTSNVIINFIDENGKKLKESEKITDYVNNPYNTNVIDIDGYEFIKVIGNPQGIIKENDTEITYIYKLIIPKTGTTSNYQKEIISITSLILLITLIIVKKHLKRN